MKKFFGAFDITRRVWIGVAGAVVIVLALVLTYVVSQSGLGKKDITASFAQSGGVRTGDDVRSAGVKVGKVTKTKLDGGRVSMTLSVDSGIKLRSDATAEIKLSTLLGQRYVAVNIGTGQDGLPGNKITKTTVPYDLVKTLNESGVLLKDVDSNGLHQGFAELNTQMENVPASIKSTLSGLQSISGVVSNRKDQIGKLLQDVNSVTDIVSDNQYQLSVIVGQGQLLTQKITTREALVTKLLDGVAALVNEARTLGADTNNQVAPLVANLNTVSQGLEKNRQSLRNLIGVLPIVARNLTNVVGNGAYADGAAGWGLFPDNWLCFARVVEGCS